jgi:hypothetical protein
MNDHFYIGWQKENPVSFVRASRRFALVLAMTAPILAFLLVYAQKGFSSGTFEYGKETILEGILTFQPAPFLIVENDQTPDGKPVARQILLLGAGKTGAQPFLIQLLGRDFDPVHLEGSRVKLRGYLIYYDGKTAFELATGQNAFQVTGPATGPAFLHRTSLGKVILCGELTDPKCFLGVMKPGEGKPHRDCSVRCVAGGIPPVLKVSNLEGETEYYLLADQNGKPINEYILPYMADAVEVSGQLEQSNDWLILYCDPASIRRINHYALNPGPMCQ